MWNLDPSMVPTVDVIQCGHGTYEPTAKAEGPNDGNIVHISGDEQLNHCRNGQDSSFLWCRDARTVCISVIAATLVAEVDANH